MRLKLVRHAPCLSGPDQPAAAKPGRRPTHNEQDSDVSFGRSINLVCQRAVDIASGAFTAAAVASPRRRMAVATCAATSLASLKIEPAKSSLTSR